MTSPVKIAFKTPDLDFLPAYGGQIAVIVTPEGTLGVEARRVNRLSKGALARAVESERFEKLGMGKVMSLGFPAGLSCSALHVIKLPRRASNDDLRGAGAQVGALLDEAGVVVLAGNQKGAEELALGLSLRAYRFEPHKGEASPAYGKVVVMHRAADDVRRAYAPLAAVAEGVFFTRDLVNEPANVLTTTEFGNRIAAMEELGLEVEILEEAQLEELGMRTLLCVGHGSDSPSKVAVMQWKGGKKKDAPLALVGKGVVFDTGGISLKPGPGMQEMTMDMGGAGVVAGVMRTLALRKAKANVVGLVGLVENMPSGRATRPGDVVTSMKGDTVEILNTDAEGRLVLADVLWYAQERFKPSGVIDLATLTGAIIIGLGHENAGVFSNDTPFCNALLKAAETEGEGAWRMPMGKAYDDALKSRIADMQNIGGRPAGSITAAQFLGRFIKEDMPWAHIDIAGVTLPPKATSLAPKGATGWGVMTLNRLVAERCE